MSIRVKAAAPRHSFMPPYAEYVGKRWYVTFVREDDPCTMYVVRWAAKPTRKQVKLAVKSVARLGI